MELGFDLSDSRGEGSRDLEVCRQDLIESAGFEGWKRLCFRARINVISRRTLVKSIRRGVKGIRSREFLFGAPPTSSAQYKGLTLCISSIQFDFFLLCYVSSVC